LARACVFRPPAGEAATARVALARLRSGGLQIDVFTLVPHAYAWLTEQRPVAAVLGEALELRLFSYRDTTPLRAGQVDDEPYGGGAGMVLRVDVVARALDTAYGGRPPARVIAFTPQGRQLDQRLVEELAGEDHLALLTARFEGFDERVVEHLATDTVSVGPYVLSNGDLPAMVLVDGVARLLPGALGAEASAREETFSAELDGGVEYPHYTRPAEFRGWRVPDVLLSGDHGRIAAWRREQSRARTGART
jgi:tRNA (guanine37-N1)-methyltransferase